MSDDDHYVTVRRVNNVDDPLLAGFVSTYKDVFAGSPYFEEYADEQIRDDVWIPHIGECIIVATTDDGSVARPESVVGLACCHAVLAPTEPKIRDFLLSRQELPELFDPARAIFMSELAVRDDFRRRGLGQTLVLERFRWGLKAGFTHYAMRTAADGSNSRRMYERIGSVLAPFVQDVSEGGVISASKSRIYMYGSIANALAWHRNI